LCDLGYLKAKSKSLKNYIKYRKVILSIVQAADCSIRDLDRALFAYHKLALNPRYNKEKNNCGTVKWSSNSFSNAHRD
jgi:hypothetical protein